MTQNEFLRDLETQLEMAPGILTGEEQLVDLEQWDSLRALGFVVWASKKFDLVIEGAQVIEAKTVKDLMSLLGGRVHG